MVQKVKFGLTLSNRGVPLGLTTPDKLLELAEMADASGAFEHVWVGDSIMAKPRMESITLMAGIAARTRRVKIGPACMASFPSRNPILLAYQWASLDLLSNGRMILAACMGGSVGEQQHRVEYTNMGIQASVRAQLMEENITILRKLWTEDRVTYEGKFHKLEGAFIEPKPVQNPPPIWVVSAPRNPRRPVPDEKPHIVERSLRRVARMGDGWMTVATPASSFAEFRREIFGYTRQYGRSFENFPCCMYYNIKENREEAFQESKKYLEYYYYPTRFTRQGVEDWVALGTTHQCIKQIQTYIDAGASDITLRFLSWDQKAQFKRCVEEVLPHLL